MLILCLILLAITLEYVLVDRRSKENGKEPDSNYIQLFFNRPLPVWGNYKTPIKKLYICRASTHPGPAVCRGSRVAVPVIMEELGINFKKVISK
jgi:hypothetical protein